MHVSVLTADRSVEMIQNWRSKRKSQNVNKLIMEEAKSSKNNINDPNMHTHKEEKRGYVNKDKNSQI